MPADRPINLNQQRKIRARAAARAKADTNAVRFGRSKADRDSDAATEDRKGKHLDGHRISDDDG